MLRDDQIILAPLRGFLPKPYDQAPLREAIGKVPLRAHPDSEVFIALIRLGTIDLLRNGSD